MQGNLRTGAKAYIRILNGGLHFILPAGSRERRLAASRVESSAIANGMGRATQLTKSITPQQSSVPG